MKFRAWISILILAVALAPVALSGERHDAKPAKSQTNGALEVEPTPPLSLQARLVNLQKNSNGGIASVALDAIAAADLREVTLTVTLPQGVSFSDGTQVYSQTINIASGATFDLPKDLIVSKDGKYNVSLEAVGNTSQGKPVRRGMTYKLLVGVQDKLPAVKDGAIEYKGVPGGGN